MKNFLLIITGSLLLGACSGEDSENNELLPQPEENTTILTAPETQVDTTATVETIETVYTKETYFTEGLGWGYKILADGKTYINQPHIPAVSGSQGFESEEKAAKTADFAIYKLEQGIMPPTISVNELDSLGVLGE